MNFPNAKERLHAKKESFMSPTLNGGESAPFPDMCLFCDLEIENEKPVEVLGIYDRLDGYAHDSCYTCAAERAQERFIENFYGSSEMQTEKERYDAAAAQKRSLR
jgi:hypothetical protein